MKECNTKEITSKQEIDLSIIPVSTQKIPFGAWKHFQTQIGGEIKHNFEIRCEHRAVAETND